MQSFDNTGRYRVIVCPSGTSWSCPSPTLTPPFPLPPTPTPPPTPPSAPDPDPVEALLLLKSSVGVAGGVTAVEPQESDEGIVSDQSNEFDDKKVSKYFSTIVIINKIFISC